MYIKQLLYQARAKPNFNSIIKMKVSQWLRLNRVILDFKDEPFVQCHLSSHAPLCSFYDSPLVGHLSSISAVFEVQVQIDLTPLNEPCPTFPLPFKLCLIVP